MGLKNESGTGSGSVFLSIANGAIWQTKGYDPESPNYTEETYEKMDKSEGTRKGCRYTSLSGHLQSVYFKDTDFGEFMNVYIEDKEDGQLYNLSFPIKDGYTAYNNAKRMMIALMSIDQAKSLTINVMGKKEESGFLNVTLWVTQDAKSLVLNPNQNPEYFKADKHKAMPDEIKEHLASTRTKTPEENKVLTKKQKGRAREDEQEDIKLILEEFYIPTINAEHEASKNGAPKAKKAVAAPVEDTEPETETPPEVVKQEVEEAAEAETPPVAKKETARERIMRLKAEREAKK